MHFLKSDGDSMSGYLVLTPCAHNCRLVLAGIPSECELVSGSCVPVGLMKGGQLHPGASHDYCMIENVLPNVTNVDKVHNGNNVNHVNRAKHVK
jgi:hypothetical protein